MSAGWGRRGFRHTLGLLVAASAPCLLAHAATTLHETAKEGDVDSARALIAAGTDVSTRDKSGNTALHVAAGYGHTALVGALIRAGADVNASNRSGLTPLHAAAMRGYTAEGALVRTLLKKTTISGSITVKDRSNTANGDAGTTQEVNWSGADAAELRKADTVRALIRAGADVNASNRGGLTPLHAAAINDGVEREVVADSVRALTEAGADANALSKEGYTPVHLADYGGHADIVRLLGGPVLVTRVAPVYPRRAKARGITGAVTVEFCVAPSGKPRDMEVVDETVPGLFARAATGAIARFRYEPQPAEVCGVRRRVDFGTGEDLAVTLRRQLAK
ncbi:MAG: TonB family protein [Gammaproteobacteria bacterium]|nr:TonB family protein [Gammaproteobacteria bacterium]